MNDATRYRVSASSRVTAPAARVYDIIADYHNGHPHIVPPQFRNMQVERGGRGAGTVVSFEVKAFGRTQSFRHAVEEPEPGRVLVERDTNGSDATTFIVEPGAHDGESRVTISSVLHSRSGLLGALERAMSSAFLQRLYRQELANLEAFAQRGN